MKKKGGGIGSVLLGVILIIVCTVLLFKNEGRAVNRAKALGNMEDAMEIDASDLEVKDGAMILLADYAKGSEELRDSEFGVSAPADTIKMSKEVSMYQWKEEKITENDETSYRYSKEWYSSVNDSNEFQDTTRENPSVMKYASEDYVSESVMMGSYRISSGFVSKMGGWKDLQVENVNATTKMMVSNNYIFISISGNSTYESPEIGDYLVEYTYVPSAEYTVLGAKKEDQVISYTTKNGNLEEVELGILNKEGLQVEKTSENKTTTWLFRAALIIGMIIGNAMIASPITKVLNVIPFLGNIVNTGIGFLGFVFGLCWSLLVIAVGWIVYRPLLGIGLLAIVGALLFLAAKKGEGTKEEVVTTAS